MTKSTPAKKVTGDLTDGDKSRSNVPLKPLLPASFSGNSSKSRGSKPRVALVDLTQDSSSDSSDCSTSEKCGGALAPKQTAITSKLPPAAVEVSNSTNTSSGKPDTIDKIVAGGQQQQQQKQRRSKWDRQPQRGPKTSGSIETPISIFEDESRRKLSPVKADAKATKAKSLPKSRPPPVMAKSSPKKAKSPHRAKSHQARTSLSPQQTTTLIQKGSIQSYFPAETTPMNAGSLKSSRTEEKTNKNLAPPNIPEWLLEGRLVHVARRCGPGMNNPGGLGNIEKVYTKVVENDANNNDQTEKLFVDVKYLPTELKSRDRGISLEYISDNQKFDLERTRSGSRRTRGNPPTKTTSLSPRSCEIYADALGLVRVADPYQMTCNDAVTQARKLLFDPKGGTFINNTFDVDAGSGMALPRRVQAGNYLGRSSSGRSSSRPKFFLDLGMGHLLEGISRKHVKIIEVNGVNADESQKELQQTPLSQISAATSASASGSSSPSILVEVDSKATNGVVIHYTRKGERKATFLEPGKQKSLKIGDAIEFFSKVNISFCVVGLSFDEVENGDADTAARGIDEGINREHNRFGRGDTVCALKSGLSPEKKRPLPLGKETGDVTVRKRKKKTPAVRGYDQGLVQVDKDIAEVRSSRKEDTDIIQSRDPPMAAHDTLKLSPTKYCGPIKKDKNATTLDIESSQETEIETSTAKALAIPANLPSAQFEENEKSDIGNTSLDAVITGTSGDSRNKKCELASMEMAPELLDEEKDCKPTSLKNTPLVATKEDVSLIRKGDTVEVVSIVPNMFGDNNIER